MNIFWRAEGIRLVIKIYYNIKYRSLSLFIVTRILYISMDLVLFLSCTRSKFYAVDFVRSMS